MTSNGSKSMRKQSNDSKPVESEKWYRYAMVWMIIALPLIAVVASLTTVVIAYKNAPEIIAAPEISNTRQDDQH